MKISAAIVTSKSQNVGIGILLLSCLSVALTPNCAKIAYQEGANLLAVFTVRSLTGLLGLGLFQIIRRRSFYVPRSAFWFGSITGMTQALTTVGIMGAVAFINVSLAVLIFFLHPFLIAIINHFRGESQLTPALVGLILLGLFGLGMTLAVDINGVNLVGISLATLGLISVTFMILVMVAACRHAGVIRANFYTLLWATFYILIAAAIGPMLGVLENPVFPETLKGWLALIGAGLTFTVGYVLFFVSVSIIGTSRAAMLSIVEPLFAILIAISLVGEWFSITQWIGAIIIVTSLLCAELIGDHK